MADVHMPSFGFREHTSVSPRPVRDASKTRIKVSLTGTALGLVMILTSGLPALGAETPDSTPLNTPLTLGATEQAYTAFQQGDFETARSLWKQAAATGDASAQYNLGLIHAEGRGVLRNPGIAMNWWLLAARNGHAQAQHNLALAYISGETIVPGVVRNPRMEEAISWLRKASDSGLASSRYALGTLLLVRANNEDERSEAIEFLTSAAYQGLVEAQFFLGKCYFDGDGVEIDRREALALFLKSAAAGHAPAQDRIAALYQSGDYVPKDRVEALAWANLASQSGLTSARDRRQSLIDAMSEADIAAATTRADELSKD